MLLLRYRDLREAPVCTADRVCAFLGVETGRVGSVPRRHVRPDVHGRTVGPTADERAAALEWFADDVARLEALTGRDLRELGALTRM